MTCTRPTMPGLARLHERADTQKGGPRVLRFGPARDTRTAGTCREPMTQVSNTAWLRAADLGRTSAPDGSGDGAVDCLEWRLRGMAHGEEAPRVVRPHRAFETLEPLRSASSELARNGQPVGFRGADRGSSVVGRIARTWTANIANSAVFLACAWQPLRTAISHISEHRSTPRTIPRRIARPPFSIEGGGRPGDAWQFWRRLGGRRRCRLTAGRRTRF